MKVSVKAILEGAAGAILATLIGWGVEHFTGWLSKGFGWVKSLGIYIQERLIEKYLISGWILLILGILSLIFIVLVICILLYRRRQIKEDERLPFRKYKEDYIYNLKWRWEWSWNNEVVNLWCYCPHCDATLVYSNDYYLSETSFICENCDALKGKISRGTKNYAIGAVKREIDRRIRTQAYK